MQTRRTVRLTMTCACRFMSGCAMRKQSFEGALCSPRRHHRSDAGGGAVLQEGHAAAAHGTGALAHRTCAVRERARSNLRHHALFWLSSSSLLDYVGAGTIVVLKVFNRTPSHGAPATRNLWLAQAQVIPLITRRRNSSFVAPTRKLQGPRGSDVQNL